jgi:uncharacterized protein HemX
MTQTSSTSTTNVIELSKESSIKKTHENSTGELVVKGVATAVAATAIIESGRGVLVTISRHPLVVLGLGIVAGYLTHKYRKELVTITSKTAEQSKDFILQQKQNIKDLIADVKDNEEQN